MRVGYNSGCVLTRMRWLDFSVSEVGSALMLVYITEIPCKSPPRTKARLKIFKNYPSLSINTIARADKSAQVNKAVLTIHLGEFTDYSLVAIAYRCNHTAVSKRIRGLTKT
jgi:hypothetical protein